MPTKKTDQKKLSSRDSIDMKARIEMYRRSKRGVAYSLVGSPDYMAVGMF